MRIVENYLKFNILLWIYWNWLEIWVFSYKNTFKKIKWKFY